MEKEFKKLTKQYAKDMIALIRTLKRQEPEAAVAAAAEEEEEVEVEEPKKVADADDWTCAGQLWNVPALPCSSVGDKSKIKTGILHNGQRVTVCKECFLARERKKNQAKRDQKRAKIQNAIQ